MPAPPCRHAGDRGNLPSSCFFDGLSFPLSLSRCPMGLWSQRATSASVGAARGRGLLSSHNPPTAPPASALHMLALCHPGSVVPKQPVDGRLHCTAAVPREPALEPPTHYTPPACPTQRVQPPTLPTHGASATSRAACRSQSTWGHPPPCPCWQTAACGSRQAPWSRPRQGRRQRQQMRLQTHMRRASKARERTTPNAEPVLLCTGSMTLP